MGIDRAANRIGPFSMEPHPWAGPVYFLSLALQNIRCFGSRQLLDLSNGSGNPSQWTVILGENGVGKTTLLQCLAQSEPTLEDIGTASPNPRGLPVWMMRAARSNFLKEARRSLEWGQDAFLSSLEIQAATGSKLTHTQTDGRIATLKIRQLPNRLPVLSLEDDKNLSDVLCCGYGASRRMGATSLSEAPQTDATASLFTDEVELLNAEEWLLQADYAALSPSAQQEQAIRRRDQLIEVLIEVLPDVDEIRFVRPTEASWSPRVEVHTPYGWVTIKQLSLGYRAMMAWVVDFVYRLFQRYPDSPNPLAEPAVVLVDEIDLHLHPRWQRSIMSYLSARFPNTQFIVTAHSPLIVQAATDANLVLLRQEGDHVVIDNDVEAVHNWRIDQVLTSLFGLESARPPQIEPLLAERTEILSKPKLTAADRRRVRELEARIGDLPTGETPEDMEAMDIIRQAAAALKDRERRRA